MKTMAYLRGIIPPDNADNSSLKPGFNNRIFRIILISGSAMIAALLMDMYIIG